MKAQTTLRNLPIGIQNFESLRNDDYLSIDKTELIYRLVTTGRYYFLSRPRRFGKSLLMSTIHSYFSGRKDLFEGLAIEKLEKEWLEALEHILEEFIVEQESIYGRNPAEKELGRRFQGIIRHTFGKVLVG